ncbi:MAG: chemotaxis protein CheA [Myxococcota bacterium]
MNDKEFRAEASETVEALARGVSQLDSGLKTGKVSPALINDVFRAAHSLKGVAGLFGVEALGQLTHTMEDLLDALRLGKLPLTSAVLSALDDAVEVFQKLVAGGRENDPKLLDALTRVAQRMAAVRTGDGAEPEGRTLADLDLPQEFFTVLTEYEEHRLSDSAARGVPLYLVHAPLSLDGFDLALAKLTDLLKARGELITTLPSSQSGPGGIAFDMLFAGEMSAEEVKDAIGALSDQYTVTTIGRRNTPAPKEPPPLPVERETDTGVPAPATLAETVRVDIEKLDRLMNVVGEMAVAKSGIARVSEMLKAAGQANHTPVLELQKLARVLERKIDELQSGIMEVRMVPLAQTFERLSRLARKTSREVGKDVQFITRGEDTELDKLLMEQLSDPLIHLVRNAVDHGIEPKEARLKAGKPELGTITVSAQPRGHHVLISVEDDGGGLDEVNIRRTALERGLVTEERVGSLSRRELWNLIFLPGFSTRRETTDLSGRGVGMDVVRTNISRLSGMIEIDSNPGRGTRFTLTVPITLAIIQSLVIRVRGRTFALPLNGVLEILAYEPNLLRTVEGREVFQTRKGSVPLLRLGDVFGFGGEDNPRGYVVLAGVALNRVGLVVDELVGQQDIVIKPLGRLLKGLRGIAGATDLGEASTVLVLDVGGLLEEALGLSAAA